MRLLLDANLSPALVPVLTAAGFDVVHVADLDLLRADDDTIFDRASADGLVVVTADSDFVTMLALRRATSPSVVLLRHVTEQPLPQHGALLTANMPSVIDALEHGAIVSLSPTRLAVRRLPIES